VEPGTRVEADTTVCIIEVMKLMNSIPAGCAGVVRRVLVNNAEPVEYDQPLIAIEPKA
jgi:biotin carboxyl carrier protein